MERSTSSERGLVWQLLVLVQSAAEAGDFFIGSPSQPNSHRLSNLYSECRNQALSPGTAIRPASLYCPSRKGGNGARTASFHVADFDRGCSQSYRLVAARGDRPDPQAPAAIFD